MYFDEEALHWAVLIEECKYNAEVACDSVQMGSDFSFFMIDLLNDDPDFWNCLGLSESQIDDACMSDAFWFFSIFGEIDGIKDFVVDTSRRYCSIAMGQEYDNMF